MERGLFVSFFSKKFVRTNIDSEEESVYHIGMINAGFTGERIDR